jgi:hypothetical protein
MFNLNDFPKDPFLWGLSTHGYSHSARVQLQHGVFEKNFTGVLNYMTTYGLVKDWVDHWENSLDQVDNHGGVAHLYFHSWEIDEQKHWHKLEEALKKAASRKGFVRVTNSELFNLWPAQGRN